MGRNNNFRRGKNRSGNNKEKSNVHENAKNAERGNRNASSAGGERRQREREHTRQFANTITKKELAETAEAIREYKAKNVVCELCGEPITDIESAIANRKSGKPVHFDCVLSQLAESEALGQNEKLTYIGQGKFAVLHFENIHDMRHFTIRREIEWEERENRHEWRNEIASLYSQVK